MKLFLDEYGSLIVECVGGAIILTAILSGYSGISRIVNEIAIYAAG